MNSHHHHNHHPQHQQQQNDSSVHTPVPPEHVPGITYDGQRRLFRLYTKTTLYAFRVDDARNLEHLYWGPSLPHKDDITYLFRSHVPTPFDPKGSIDASSLGQALGLDELNRIDSVEQLTEQWRQYTRNASNREQQIGSSPSEDFKRSRRLENASWRLWHQQQTDKLPPHLAAHPASSASHPHFAPENLPIPPLYPPLLPPSPSSSASQSATVSALIHPPLPDSHTLASASASSISVPTPSPIPTAPTTSPLPKSFEASTPSVSSGGLHRTRSISELETTDRDHVTEEEHRPHKRVTIAEAANTEASTSSSRTTHFDVGLKSTRYSPLSQSRSVNLGALGASVGSFADLGQEQTTNWGALDPEELGKNTKLLEFSDQGTGDYREASFRVTFQSDGSSVCPLQFKRHRIVNGKMPMPPPLPAMYTDTTEEATTLIVEMEDSLTSLRFNLIYTVLHDYDIITRRTVVVNNGVDSVTLRHVVSGTFDFDAENAFYLTQLAGGWAHERDIVTQKLDYGVHEVKSTRGASSHQFNPFIMITPDTEPEEDRGECYGFALVYSGNFSAKCEITEYGRLRVNCGINPDGFQWLLEAKGGENSFYSPEVIMSYSASGMGQLSRTLHDAFRDRLIPRQWRGKVPPVLINTWEAAYFNVSHEVVIEIAQAARKANIELLVLDDGWFGHRENTNSGLGDWYPNKSKFPFGIDGVARAVNNIGLKFGIWVEPEMISLDSDLYRAHPDWCLHVPTRNRTTGRNQLVLDFSRPVVRNHVYEQLFKLLTSANIEYVKWDMNRHLTEVFSQERHPGRQGEVSHRFILGLYELLGRLTEKFPHVLFETCSGGGGRFDAGMLYFAPQIWTSDNTDALSRVSIQYGTSLAYPAMTMGAHVSTVPNHQTLRTTPMKTRSIVAMSGTFGYELDPRTLSDEDINELREYIELHSRIAPLVYNGDMYRLWSPFKSDSAAWMFVSKDQLWALVIAVNIRRVVGRLLPRLKLRGLCDEWLYTVEELCPGTVVRNADTGAIEHTQWGVYQYGDRLSMKGRTLRNAGLPVKFMFDSDCVILEITSIQEKAKKQFRRSRSILANGAMDK